MKNMTIEFQIFALLGYWECNSKTQRSFGHKTMAISKVVPRIIFYSFIARFAGKITDKDFKMPSNVKFMSWLPQNDLLAHNKTKLFITHGGMNGKVEFSHIHPVKMYFYNFLPNLY